MPAKSGKQYRAMQAAKHGKSTLGIPQSVGEEFVKATPKAKRKAFNHGKASQKRTANKTRSGRKS